jgi:hypothetical protein
MTVTADQERRAARKAADTARKQTQATQRKTR